MYRQLFDAQVGETSENVVKPCDYERQLHVVVVVVVVRPTRD